ncbi:MAG: hypothetical protein QOJ01_1528 [Solirubrobacterales bacterium]|jgi:hypothetical protein|nr:hypothetical protein [Solirubrobacterales bacterium]
MIDKVRTRVSRGERERSSLPATVDPVKAFDEIARSSVLAAETAKQWAAALVNGGDEPAGSTERTAAGLLAAVATRAGQLGREAESMAQAARDAEQRGPKAVKAETRCGASAGAFRVRQDMTPNFRAAQLMASQMLSDGARPDAIRRRLASSFEGVEVEPLVAALLTSVDYSEPVTQAQNQPARVQRAPAQDTRLPSVGLAHTA